MRAKHARYSIWANDEGVPRGPSQPSYVETLMWRVAE